jgi:serine/threonine protein kinase
VLRTLRGREQRMPPAIVGVRRALRYSGALEMRPRAGRTNRNGRWGAIHRDVTPSNVILTPAGEVKLLDFGVATFKNALQATKSGTVKGKPAYLAPEQLEARRSTAASISSRWGSSCTRC